MEDLNEWKTKTTVGPGILFKIQANRLETLLDTKKEEIRSARAKTEMKASIHKGSEDGRLTHRMRGMKDYDSARELQLFMIN